MTQCWCVTLSQLSCWLEIKRSIFADMSYHDWSKGSPSKMNFFNNPPHLGFVRDMKCPIKVTNIRLYLRPTINVKNALFDKKLKKKVKKNRYHIYNNQEVYWEKLITWKEKNAKQKFSSQEEFKAQTMVDLLSIYAWVTQLK